MSIIALILLLLGFLIWGIFGVASQNEEANSVEVSACALTIDGDQQCAPTLMDGEYQIPAYGTVIHATVNAGPLPPEYQQGYEITIDANGLATVIVTPLGGSNDLGTDATAQQVITTVDLGPEGLQDLLHQLDNLNFFFLPTTDSTDIADVPVGGSVSDLEVTLVDGDWDVLGAALDAGDQATLDAAQGLIVTAVGLDPNNPTAVPATGTPSAT